MVARRIVSACCVMGLAVALVVISSPTGFAQGNAAKEKPTPKAKPVPRGKGAPAEVVPGVRDYSSKNFLLHTDLSADDAKELLTRLETMLILVSRYFGKPNPQTIEMNVVQDQSVWPNGSIHPDAIASIEGKAGITLSLTMGQRNALGQTRITAAKSIVWAVADRGTPQHEAVHAYCHQVFGRTGPTWYAEGMAEIGQYWREKDESVRIHDGVLQYLKSEEPKELTEITAPGQRTGDSWQNYAWRWALCHLLAGNTNYRDRFKPLGLALLNDQRTSFEDVYGPMAKEISFEYDFFLKHLDQGYRVDLCSWDWKTKFTRVKGSPLTTAKVEATRGWQASRVLVKTGDKLAFTTTGEWTVAKDAGKVSADGQDDGKGKLVGILFSDYRLSEPFELGASRNWESPGDGNLFLRCRDDWGSLGDNSGTVTVKFKLAE